MLNSKDKLEEMLECNNRLKMQYKRRDPLWYARCRIYDSINHNN